MSMHCTVLLKKIPTRLEFQNYLDQAQIPIKLMKSMEVADYSAFTPMRLSSYKAGVETYIDDFDPDAPTELDGPFGDRRKTITFRFGGRATEYCCAFGAAAALHKYADGLVYCEVPDPMSYEQIIYEFNEIFPQAKMEARNSPHRSLLKTVARQLPDFVKKEDLFFYLPLGQCARGFMIFSDREEFMVSMFVWPLSTPTDFLFPMPFPTDLNLAGHIQEIYQASTGRYRWRYDISTSAEEIVELVTKKLVPYFRSIENPSDLADSLLKQFCKSADITHLEKTGLACAAAGKYQEALNMLDRAVELAGPDLRFDYILAKEKRCRTIAELIREKRFDMIDQQLAEWKSYTIKKCKLGGLAK